MAARGLRSAGMTARGDRSQGQRIRNGMRGDGQGGYYGSALSMVPPYGGTFRVRSFRRPPVHRELLRIGGACENDVQVGTSSTERAMWFERRADAAEDMFRSRSLGARAFSAVSRGYWTGSIHTDSGERRAWTSLGQSG